MLGVCTSLQLAMIWRIYSERFIPSLLALRSICFNSLSVNQNLILSVLFSIIVILSFWGFRGRGKRPPNKCVCGVCTQTRCLLMRCHLQASRIWCTQIQCLLNPCRAARHFWQNVFCFPMSSKTLPPFRKNCRFTWWRFYIPARNFTAQSLRSVCFPHTSWRSHISIQPVIQFSRCCDQSLH